MSGSHGSDADDASSENIPELLHFVDDGDVRVTVYDGGVQKAFTASSNAMSLVCDPWKRMLAGGFKEAEAGEDGMKEVSLPDDNPRALIILLNIAHLRFSKLPVETLPFEALRDLLVLSNKFCATAILKPWIETWSGFCRITLRLDSHYTCGQEELLFIYWELGAEYKLTQLAKIVAREIELTEDGKCLNEKGKVLNPEDSDCFFPPGLLDSMLRLRTQTIDYMLNELYSCVDRYRTAYDHKNPTALCKAGNSAQRKGACDSLLFGSLMLFLQSAGLSFERPSTETITWSVLTLFKKLMDLNISHLPRGSGYEDHSYCNFGNEFLGSIRNILEQMASPVLESHRVHMKRQSELLNLQDDI